jgi:tetratricopeptide (TPR) repeat protein
MTTDRPDFEQERELGKLTAAANLQRMRGQWPEAEDTCRQALAIAPNDVAMHEMLGDILHELGKLDGALNEYKQAMRISPGRASLETKHAKLTLEIGERERARAIAEDMLANPKKYAAREKSPIWALCSAVMVPGLGQLYNGEVTKAIIVFTPLLLFLASFALFPTHPRDPGTLSGVLSGVDPIVQWLGTLAGISYIYGLIDATVRAEKLSKAAKAQSISEPQ